MACTTQHQSPAYPTGAGITFGGVPGSKYGAVSSSPTYTQGHHPQQMPGLLSWKISSAVSGAALTTLRAGLPECCTSTGHCGGEEEQCLRAIRHLSPFSRPSLSNTALQSHRGLCLSALLNRERPEKLLLRRRAWQNPQPCNQGAFKLSHPKASPPATPRQLGLYLHNSICGGGSGSQLTSPLTCSKGY